MRCPCSAAPAGTSHFDTLENTSPCGESRGRPSPHDEAVGLALRQALALISDDEAVENQGPGACPSRKSKVPAATAITPFAPCPSRHEAGDQGPAGQKALTKATSKPTSKPTPRLRAMGQIGASAAGSYSASAVGFFVLTRAAASVFSRSASTAGSLDFGAGSTPVRPS